MRVCCCVWGQLRPNELAGSLWALQRQPPAGWLDVFFESSRGALSSLRPDEVAILLRGLAGVQVSFDEGRSCGKRVVRCVVFRRCVAVCVGQLRPNELAGSLRALQRLHQQPPQGWLEALFEQSRGYYH